MRISKIAMVVAFSLAVVAFLSPVRAQPVFVPTSGIFSNIESVSRLRPRVVLDYVSSCVSLDAIGNVEFPENAECLFDNYVSIQFPGSEFGDRCSPPDVNLDDIKADLLTAVGQCPGFDDFGFIDTAALVVQAVFAADSCWEELCEENSDILLRIESQYIEQCADVDLPYPAEYGGMFGTEDDAEASVLTCMLEHVMSTPAFAFGLDSSPPVVCWPPAYDNIETICPTLLAKPAHDKCTDSAEAFFGMMFKDDKFEYSMSMKMYADDDDPQDDDDDDDDDGTDDLTLVEKFCTILAKLSTEEVLDCLFEICDTSVGPDTDMPSEVPSSFPSVSSVPSLEPSWLTSSVPSLSEQPSKVPTFGPSGFPSSSAIPSYLPSSLPSAGPSSSAIPSYLPSEQPSLGPTPSPTPWPPSKPSGTPSSRPSGAPSVSPSSIPSVSPSSNPSASPSLAPSASPTFDTIQSIIEVQITSEFTVSIPGDVNVAVLAEIIEDGLEDMLPGDVDATVLSIGGNPVRRRRLQDLRIVEVLLELVEPCSQSDSSCEALGANLVATLNEMLATSVTDGGITDYIQDQGVARNINVLANVTVVPDSYTVTSSVVELNEPVTVTNPEGVQTSNAATAFVSTATMVLSLLTCTLFFLAA